MAHFTYQDTGAPAPPDAGAHTGGGRCVRVDDQAGSAVFDYDARGRTSLKRSTPAGSSTSYQIDLNYGADGKIATVTYPQGSAGRLQLSYQYDVAGRLSAIPGVVQGIDYDLGGRRLAVHYANGVTTSRTFDPATLALTQLVHANPSGAFRSTSFTWDGAGNLTAIASPDPALTATFAYDDLHRLVSVTPGSGTPLTCAYDDAGNITQKSDVGAYAYGAGAPATCLTSAGSATFTYTALGQVASSPWGTHAYDNLGRLTGIAGATNATFTYDYTGSRVSATFTTGAASHVRITPDPFYAIEDGTLVRYLFDGERLAARDSDAAGRAYLHEDHLGSIVAFSDGGGNVVDEIVYDAFGAVVARKATDATATIGFAGGELDPASGLLYLKARYYHPKFGRFLSVDPIVQDMFVPVAWNAYAYCRNNPQSYVDPTGRSWWQILVGALAVVAIVALTVVSILTFGATTPLLVVAIGLVAGGVVGGIAASQAGGDFGDILLGVLVGAAVGGWAAFASVFAGGAVASALGIKGTLLGAIAAGAINGAINGAAIGFAAGFAGGNTTLDSLLAKVALGALVGAIVGGALGGISYSFSTSPGPSQSLSQQVQQAATQPQPQIPGWSGSGYAANVPAGATPAPTVISDPTQAIESVGGKLAVQALTPVAEAAARAALISPFASAITIFVVDGATSTVELGVATWILQQIGVVTVSGKFS
jgi:RHS repeat-associated protein